MVLESAMSLVLKLSTVLVGESTVITPASMVQAAAEQKPQLAREYVNIFNPSLMKLRGLIDWEQMEEAPRLAHRFTPSNCELMRFGAQSSLHLVHILDLELKPSYHLGGGIYMFHTLLFS